MTDLPITDLIAIRARAANAAKELINQKTGKPNLFQNEEEFRPVRASARDVPILLEIIDGVAPLLQAARNFVQNNEDTSTLEALVEATDRLPWLILDILGVLGDDEEDGPMEVNDANYVPVT